MSSSPLLSRPGTVRLGSWGGWLMLAILGLTLPPTGTARGQEPAKDAPPAAQPASDAPAAGGAAQGGADAAPVANAGAEPAPPQTKSFLMYAIEASGLVGFIILLLSIYMVALVIRLFMEFRVNEAVPPPLVEKLEGAIKERKFQEAYDVCREDNSYLARLVRTGVANLPIGRAEAKEAMNAASDEVLVTMESKVSYLAVVGSLGPMLGLLGTVWGMILAFQNISTTGAQPRPDQLAGNIATALFTTLEGLILAVPAIFFFAFFRNRVAIIAMEATKVAERTINAFWNAARQQPGAKAPA